MFEQRPIELIIAVQSPVFLRYRTLSLEVSNLLSAFIIPISGAMLGDSMSGSCILCMWHPPLADVAYMTASPFLPLGSCIGISNPFISTANFSEPWPIVFAASLTPLAKIFPSPSREAIISISFIADAAFPKFNSSPPVSSKVSSPFSKHSIAKAMDTPVEIASRL